MDVLFFDDDMLQENMHFNEILGYFVEDLVGRQNDNDETTRNQNYYETVIPNYSLDEFHNHFRMSRGSMQILMTELGHRLRDTATRIPLVDVQKKTLFTIWILAKPESFFACGDRFGLAQSTGHYIFKEIVTLLYEMRDIFIQWPSEVQCQQNAIIFEEKSRGIPKVIGAIDATHILVKKPKGNAYDYYNRYQSHSILLQGVCDTKRRFINISAGHPGRMHDARVFRKSLLYQCIIDEEDPLISREQHIIGDCGYPLLNELITPFKNNGHLAEDEIRFNKRLSSARSVIERAFSLLKKMWRRLNFLDMSDFNLASKVIVACCVLQNFIIDHGDAPVDIKEEHMEEDNDLPLIRINERRRHALGVIKRNEIVQSLH